MICMTSKSGIEMTPIPQCLKLSYSDLTSLPSERVSDLSQEFYCDIVALCEVYVILPFTVNMPPYYKLHLLLNEKCLVTICTVCVSD